MGFSKRKTPAGPTKVIIVEDQIRRAANIEARAKALFDQVITPAERSVLASKSLVDGEAARVRQRVTARARSQAEDEAAQSVAAETTDRTTAADADAAREARGLITQMILQNLNVNP